MGGGGGKGGHHVDLGEGKPSHLSLLLLVYSSTLPTRIPFCIGGGSLAEACFPSPNRGYQTRVVPGPLAVQSQTLQIPRWLVRSLFNQTPSWHECTKQVFFFSVCLGGFFWFFFCITFFCSRSLGGSDGIAVTISYINTRYILVIGQNKAKQENRKTKIKQDSKEESKASS